MSTPITLPSLNLSMCVWKATKLAAGGAVFVAMSLPIAFPARDANSASAPVPAMTVPQPSPLAAKAKAAKVEAAQTPSKRPSPKNV